jgi:inorganic pyrophosphatase
VKHIKDLGKAFVQELEEFLANYHELSGTKYRIRDARGPREAKRRIKQGMRQSKKKQKHENR